MERTRDVAFLKEKTTAIRKDIIEMLAEAGSGHPGGSLSSAEIFATLYFAEMNVDPANRTDPDRDRFILSKGHCAPGFYAVLGERGYFDTKEFKTLRRFGSILQGHPDMKRTPGVEISSGSLGQGLSVGIGMALAAKLDKKSYRVYVLMGDGELQEGQVWEAFMSAAHYKLDNLVAICDNNGLQIDGRTFDVMNPEPIADKLAAFGWHVIVVSAHDIPGLLAAYDEARATRGKPTFIVAKSVKGRGVSFMENAVDWHGKAPTREEAEKAVKELLSRG